MSALREFCLKYLLRKEEDEMAVVYAMRMASTLRNTPRCGLRHRDGCPVSLTSRRL